MRSRLLGLAVSGTLHAALVLAVLAAVSGTAPPMLFMDLIYSQVLREPAPTDPPRATPPPRARAPQGAGDAPRQTPAPVRSTSTAPMITAPSEVPREEPPAPPPAAQEPVRLAPEPVRAAPEPVRPALDPPTAPPRVVEMTPPSGHGSGGGEPVSRGDTADHALPSPSAVRGASATRGDTSGSSVASPGGERGVDPSPPGAAGGVHEGSAVALAIPGRDGDPAASDYDGYYDTLRQRIRESLKYPAVARRRGLTGKVLIAVVVEPTGAIGSVALDASSSHAVLDEAALDAVRGLRRVPFPPGVQPRRLWVLLPVVFELR